MYNVYIFPKFGKHIICSWILKINMFIQLEVYIPIQKLSLFGEEQSFSLYTKRDASVKHTLGCLWYVLQKIRSY